jgi:hypothetical protein
MQNNVATSCGSERQCEAGVGKIHKQQHIQDAAQSRLEKLVW